MQTQTNNLTDAYLRVQAMEQFSRDNRTLELADEWAQAAAKNPSRSNLRWAAEYRAGADAILSRDAMARTMGVAA